MRCDIDPPVTPAAFEPDLSEPRRLLAKGFHLVELHKYSKRPVGTAWNTRSNFVRTIDPSSTGYGLPLLANNLCSIDVDHYEMAKVGFDAWGFDIEELLSAGCRTASTRANSGGRSAFAYIPESGLRWLTISAFDGNNLGVTVLELRAKSPNLQDVVPGVVYEDKHTAELCTQHYVGERTFSDAPDLPKEFAEFWRRMSKDDEFFNEQQAMFVDAIAQAGFLVNGKHVRHLPSCDLSNGSLAFPAPGVRGSFNAEHGVAELLKKYGYIEAGGSRWTYVGATGSPGIRPIPGKDGLWHSSHGGDPLRGTFDAWCIHVLFEHGGDTEAAIRAYTGAIEDDFEVIEGGEEEQWPAITNSNYRSELPRRWVFVTESDQYFDLETHALVRPPALNRQYAHIKEFSASSKRWLPIKAASVVAESPAKTVVDCIGWQPCDASVIGLGKRRAVNTYIAPLVDREAGEPSMWLDLMHHIYGEYVELVIAHMAFTVQRPGQKIRWQIMVVSEKKRTGKSSTVAPLKHIFLNSLQVISAQNLETGWGDFEFGSKVIVIEELYQAGKGKAFFNGIKAGLVNSDLEAMNLKGRGVVRQQNLRSYYLFTNHWNAVQFDADEDKLLVVQAPDEPWSGCFREYHRAIEHGNLVGQVYKYLLDYDLSDFPYDKLPIRTSALLRLCRESAADYQKWLVELHESRQWPFEQPTVSFGSIKKALHDDRFSGFGLTGLADALREMGFTRVQVRKNEDGKRKKSRIWVPEELNSIAKESELAAMHSGLQWAGVRAALSDRVLEWIEDHGYEIDSAHYPDDDEIPW
jgi:hypothetical protein